MESNRFISLFRAYAIIKTKSNKKIQSAFNKYFFITELSSIKENKYCIVICYNSNDQWCKVVKFLMNQLKLLK